MITGFFILTTIIAFIGWLFYWTGSAALAKYMKDKGYAPPSDEEMKACCIYIWKKVLHIS